MFIDGRHVPDNSVVETDIAIIGAGAAGITIARELRHSGAGIVLIESGGLDFDPETQDLYAGESVGVPYPLESSRLRYFGGSTNHWGGWCRPLEAIDFEQRDWVPHSGWPIGRADIDPYYTKANDVCQIGPFIYDDAEAFSDGGKHHPLDLPGGAVMTRWFEYSPPTRFGSTYRKDIEASPNIKTFLNSTVLEIVAAENAASVERLRVGTLTGRRFEIRPRMVILATGGIENARLLLASNGVEKAGLGNDRGLVGRYFMEHPHIDRPCEILITNPDLVAPYYQTYTKSAGANIRGVFMFTADYLRKNRRLGTVMTFYKSKEIRSDTEVEEKDPDGARALEPGLAQLIRSTTATRANEGPLLAMRYGTGCATEQAPNPDSRITLGAEKDALGMNRSKIDWKLSASDRANLRLNLEALARAFGQWGDGNVRVLFPERDKWDEAEGWGNHHMGTTRMADDPRRGVVDANCKVHGIANLYVAGSSVFTTSATVNPTLTLVALALRLAEHVRTQLVRGV